MLRFLGYLFDMIVVVLVGRMLNRAIQHLFGTPGIRFGSRGGMAPPSREPDTVRGETVRDPMCGMFVSTELSHRLTRGTQTLHFCSRECLERYEKQGLTMSH